MATPLSFRCSPPRRGSSRAAIALPVDEDAAIRFQDQLVTLDLHMRGNPYRPLMWNCCRQLKDRRDSPAVLRLSCRPLVSCPVALFPASSEREKISFHQINKKTGNRIKYRKVDAETGDEVDSPDIIKGYEVGKGEYIEIEPELAISGPIIATDANELVADIHDRMPVILPPSDHARWLGDEADPRDLLRPFPADLMRMWPISARVNKPENDDPSIIEPIELATDAAWG
jgi:SOS response associated peptidase (SRAP)/Ku70/Ku80 beta-barrel domain